MTYKYSEIVLISLICHQFDSDTISARAPPSKVNTDVYERTTKDGQLYGHPTMGHLTFCYRDNWDKYLYSDNVFLTKWSQNTFDHENKTQFSFGATCSNYN